MSGGQKKIHVIEFQNVYFHQILLGKLWIRLASRVARKGEISAYKFLLESVKERDHSKI